MMNFDDESVRYTCCSVSPSGTELSLLDSLDLLLAGAREVEGDKAEDSGEERTRSDGEEPPPQAPGTDSVAGFTATKCFDSN